MNPLLKLLLKQMEENAVILEKYAKASDKANQHYEMPMHISDAFDHFHTGLSLVKDILKELL